jgi:cathepsin L
MIKTFVLFAVFFTVTTAFLLEPHYGIEFGRFMQKHGKTYESSAEQAYRYRIFKSNLDYINTHNANEDSFKLAVNQFADMTNNEFRERFLGTKYVKSVSAPSKHVVNPSVKLPDTVDWRTKGAVTPVKDQGQCGSCWAFSTTGSTEGAVFLKKGTLPNLSEQNLVDCSGSQGNQGCNGGLMDYGFEYIITNKGIDTEKSYPYTAEDGRCQFKAANVGATITSYKDVTSGDESALQSAVAQQPVSVAIDASHMSFQFYSSGVYYEKSCSATELDHGVLAVGYGTDSGKDYWLVKNSWAASWGDQGYIKMSRNRDNNCGISTASSYPVA